MGEILNLQPHIRNRAKVAWLRDRLTYMSIHNAVDLPLVRYAHRQTEAERARPINLENTLTFKDEPIKQTLQISYAKSPPSPSIYNTLAAIYWFMQERGYNDGMFEWDGINWICKKTGGNRNVIISDLTRLTGLHISGENLLFDFGTKTFWDVNITPFPTFIREYKVGKTLPRHVLFEVSEFWLRFIQNNLIHTAGTYIDYIALKSVLSKLLYVKLLKIFYSRDYIRLDMEKLGRWLLLENANIHSMRQTFIRSCEELEQIHFLSRYEIKESKSNKGGYTISFRARPKTAEDLKWLNPPGMTIAFGSLDS